MKPGFYAIQRDLFLEPRAGLQCIFGYKSFRSCIYQLKGNSNRIVRATCLFLPVFTQLLACFSYSWGKFTVSWRCARYFCSEENWSTSCSFVRRERKNHLLCVIFLTLNGTLSVEVSLMKHNDVSDSSILTCDPHLCAGPEISTDVAPSARPNRKCIDLLV